VIDVLAGDNLQAPVASDQHPVQALAPGTADPAFRDRVRTRCPDRRLDDPGVHGKMIRRSRRSWRLDSSRATRAMTARPPRSSKISGATRPHPGTWPSRVEPGSTTTQPRRATPRLCRSPRGEARCRSDLA
jgi:hypothetical protein